VRNSLRSCKMAWAGIWLLALGSPLKAQDAPAADAVRAVVGAWELSNAERDRSCTVNLRAPAGAAAGALAWDRKCAELFAFTRDATTWRIGAREAIQILNAQGQMLLELTEVEGGLYEGERPGEGLLFLQNVAGAANEERKADQMVGDWAFVRGGGRPLCQIAFAATPAPQDAFALRVKPGCDALIARFGPVAWRLDRGQLVLIPAAGESWRFEESDPMTWRRIPEGRQPLQLVRQ
jgi:hypothetical protein